jgi:hypothetical protein
MSFDGCRDKLFYGISKVEYNNKIEEYSYSNKHKFIK